MESQFQKYLLCENGYGSKAKKASVDTIRNYMNSFTAEVSAQLKERLKTDHGVDNYTKIANDITEHMKLLNADYISKIAQFINTTTF